MIERSSESTTRRRREWIEVCALVVLGVLIFLPALRAPLFLDDFLQGAMVEGTYPVHRGPFDLYDFIGDDNRALLFDRGLLPWWTDRHLTVRFFRPLASALLFVEHRVFSHAVLPKHLHSFLWWIGAAFAARALFRRTLAPRPARIATFIFALAPCHALPLAWLANRATLISLVFGTLGLLFYARWRQERRPLHAVGTGVLFALALLGGGEYALAFGGYVVAIEAVRRGEPLGRRALGVVPCILPALAYLGVRAAGRYGSTGSGFYTDPIHDTAAFLANAPMRAASLLGASWLTLDIGWWRSGGIAEWFLVAVLVGSAIVLVPVVRRVIASLPDPNKRSASWLVCGALIALLPALSVAPAARLLGTSMLGVAATVALVLDRVWFAPAETADSGAADRFGTLAPIAAMALGFAHLVHGPGSAWLSGRAQRESALDFASRVDDLRAKVDDVTHAEVGIVRGLASVFFLPFAVDPNGRPPPRWFVLSQSLHVVALRRDARTLDLVAAPDASLYPVGDRSLYRSTRSPFRKGEEIRVSGMTIKVLETSKLGPRSARFVFDEEPETRTWVADDYDDLHLTKLPAPDFGDVFDPRRLVAPH